jgi:8-oxo-dGTP pyrophosphatase MutT (NUDIX family)
MIERLVASADMFGGVTVDGELPDDPATFASVLAASLEAWRTDGKRLAWLKVPIDRSALIPVAVAHGFTFHHANEVDLMMVCRLVEEAFVPYHATHYIGVGGVCINERRELLVVCERHRRTSQPYYKLPGGALHPGEHLVDAVLREVLEETGVRGRIVAELDSTRYLDRKGRDKLVRWFRMELDGEPRRFAANDEVDELRWVTPDEARVLLSYEHDRALARAVGA